MKILFLTDIHGEKTYFKEIEKAISTADILLLAGDITHFGKRKEIEEIIHIIEGLPKHIFAVPGNCDYPEVGHYLTEKGINMHCRYKEVNSIYFIGIGGSLPCPGKTPYEFSDEEIGEFLDLTYEDSLAKKPFILLTHQPPYGTINDYVNGKNAGSKQLRRFIEYSSPIACFCGHIHEGIGIDRIGLTKIINPGPFKNGYYAVGSVLSNKEIAIELKSL